MLSGLHEDLGMREALPKELYIMGMAMFWETPDSVTERFLDRIPRIQEFGYATAPWVHDAEKYSNVPLLDLEEKIRNVEKMLRPFTPIFLGGGASINSRHLVQ